MRWKNLQELLSKPGEKTKLSNAAGISTGNISDWFNPDKSAQPSAVALYKMANYFKCSVDYLMDRTNIMEPHKQLSKETIHLIDMGEIIYLDTYPQPVSAGKGNIYIDDVPIPQLYPSTPISLKASYCVRISGDSMYPQYLDGDIVYIDKTKDLNINDIGIFYYNGEAYCKKYYKNNNIKKLISLNPDQERYSPIVIENGTFEIQGKVIGRFHAD